jgi:hypothetical protein
VTEGLLPTDVLTAIDDAALKTNRNGHLISTPFRFRSWKEVKSSPSSSTFHSEEKILEKWSHSFEDGEGNKMGRVIMSRSTFDFRSSEPARDTLA